jgi:hypothetical protein
MCVLKQQSEGVATLLQPMCPYVLATTQSPLTPVWGETGLLGSPRSTCWHLTSGRSGQEIREIN